MTKVHENIQWNLFEVFMMLWQIGEHSELQKYLRTIAELQTRMQEKNDVCLFVYKPFERKSWN